MIERHAKLHLSELTPFAGTNYEIKSEDLPCHVFVRLIKPKLKGWYYVGELSIDESVLDFWRGDDVMEIIYSAVDFDPMIAERFGLKTPWIVEYAFYSEVSPTKKPKGRRIMSFTKTLYKPEYYASENLEENIPETMKPYLAYYKEKKDVAKNEREIISSALEKQLAKLDGATLLMLIQSGLLNIDALRTPNKEKDEKEEEEKVEKKIIKDESSIVEQIVKEAEFSNANKSIVKEEPRETNIIQTIKEGFELIKQIPDIANALKDILSSLGLGQNNQVVEAIKKQQQAFDILLKDYERLKKEVKKLKEENYLDMLGKEVENESPRKNS